MAIVQEHYYIGNREFIKTYSDAGRYVVGGVPEGNYTEAHDPAEYNRAYTEGDPIPAEALGESSLLQDKAEAYDILIGEVE